MWWFEGMASEAVREERECGFAVGADVAGEVGEAVLAGPVLAVLSVARAVVITPLAEELMFRGALYGWLRRHSRPSTWPRAPLASGSRCRDATPPSWPTWMAAWCVHPRPGTRSPRRVLLS
jgi:hypothetical protein